MLCPFVRAMMQGSKYQLEYLSINEIGFDFIDSLFYMCVNSLICHDFVSNHENDKCFYPKIP